MKNSLYNDLSRMMSIHLLPLFMVYLAYPIVMISTRHADIGLTRSWIDLVWAVFGLLAVVSLALRYFKKPESLTVSVEFILMALLAIIVLFKWGLSWYGQDIVLIPFIMEIKPIVYLYIAVVWFVSFGKIDPESFVRFGALLGAIVVFDFFLESILAGKLSLPRVSGERNYDACLLLISYVMTFAKGRQIKSYYKIFIFLGVILTFSRTALGAAVVITLFASNMKFKYKVLTIIVMAAFIVGSFVIRDLSLTDFERMDRYWMWLMTIDLFINNPSNTFFGFPVGVSLPGTFAVPCGLFVHFVGQSDAWWITGIYPFHMHSFWLRLAITWGLPVTLLIVLSVCYLTMTRNAVTKGLCLLLLVEGMAMGVFYLSNVAIPLFLAFFSVLNFKPHLLHRAGFKVASKN